MSGCASQRLCEAWIQAIKRRIKTDEVTGMRVETGMEAERGYITLTKGSGSDIRAPFNSCKNARRRFYFYT